MKVTRYLEYQYEHKIHILQSWPWWKFYGALLLNKIAFRLAMAITELHIWLTEEPTLD